MVFAIHWHESAMGLHVFPILNLPPTSLPIPSLRVIRVLQPWAPCLMHWTWTGDLFHIDNLHVSVPFSQVIPPLPSSTESKRLFNTSVSLLLSHIQGYSYYLSKLHIYALVCLYKCSCIWNVNTILNSIMLSFGNSVNWKVVGIKICHRNFWLIIKPIFSSSGAHSETFSNLPYIQDWPCEWVLIKRLWLYLMYATSLEKEMATHSSILAWRIPWTEEPGGPLSIGSERVGHNWSDLARTHATSQPGP